MDSNPSRIYVKQESQAIFAIAREPREVRNKHHVNSARLDVIEERLGQVAGLTSTFEAINRHYESETREDWFGDDE